MAEPRPAEHFPSVEVETHAATLGMWVFLASEILLFSGLFALYAAYRTAYPAAFADGIHHNLKWLGTLNTVILLLSSWAVARGDLALEDGRTRMARNLVLLTALMGVAFLGFKGFEYASHFQHGIFPGGRGAFFVENPGRGISLFFTIYYLMTGLHAVHVTVGILLLLFFAWRISTGGLTPARPHSLTLVAMYWHLVDIIWIFLWPLFYLTGGHA